MLRVQNSLDIDIKSSEMKDGDIAVITMWMGHTQYIGRVVMRAGNHLYTIGSPILDKGWPLWFNNANDFDTCRVKKLSAGTTLVIE